MTITPRPPVGTPHPRVLVADDDRDERELLAEALSRGGYEVIEAMDGAEVVNLLDFAGPEHAAMAPLDAVV